MIFLSEFIRHGRFRKFMQQIVSDFTTSNEQRVNLQQVNLKRVTSEFATSNKQRKNLQKVNLQQVNLQQVTSNEGICNE